LTKILGALTNEKGQVAIPGLLEDVIPPTAAEMEDFARLGMTSEEFRRQAAILPGVELFGEGPELLRRLWREPSLTINSLQAGGKGLAGNVLLDSAWARFSLRLVPGLDAKQTAEKVAAYVKSLCPWGLQLKLETEAGANAWRTEPTHPVFEVAKKSLGDGYGTPAALIGCGGTIPFVEHFTDALGAVPALLVGVEDPYTNAHSENESLHLGDFKKAILSQVRLFTDVAASPEACAAFKRGNSRN
jgi:acetylornithine deacetylase/succinyl-diaminopimelate desuccinylase-like protein